MTPKQAAALLEISISQLRHLMNSDPRLKWYWYSQRCIRLDEADVLTFKPLCQKSGRPPQKFVGSIPTSKLLIEDASSRELREAFLKCDVKIKPRPAKKPTER